MSPSTYRFFDRVVDDGDDFDGHPAFVLLSYGKEDTAESAIRDSPQYLVVLTD